MIAVGDSGSVELIFHASAAQRGRVSKSATVTCNDAARPSFPLRLSAEIYDPANSDSLTPLALSMSSINWDPTNVDKEQKLVVRNTADSPVRMTMVSRPNGFAEVSVPDGEIKPGKSREIKVKIAKDFAGRDFKKSFTLELNDSAKTRISVPVVLEAQVVPPPVAKPVPGKKERYIDTTKTGASLDPKGKH